MAEKFGFRKTDDGEFLFHWDKDFEGSVTTAFGNPGHMEMTYGQAPFFLYVLAKGLCDYSFLGQAATSEIMQNIMVTSINLRYKQIRDIMETSAKNNSEVWTGMHRGRNLNHGRLEWLRAVDGIGSMIDALQEKHIDPQTLTYVGRVHGTHENSRAIHFVRSPEDLTYIAQCPYPNVVRFSRQQRISPEPFFQHQHKFHSFLYTMIPFPS